MKSLLTICILALPAAAQAMGMHGGKGGCGGGAQGCAHLAVFLYALITALGYWLLQHSDKDAGVLVKKTGRVLAWIFMVLGLLGFLCGITNHVKSSMCDKKCGGNCPMDTMEGETEDAPAAHK
jgi:hypothetical protein